MGLCLLNCLLRGLKISNCPAAQPDFLKFAVHSIKEGRIGSDTGMKMGSRLDFIDQNTKQQTQHLTAMRSTLQCASGYLRRWLLLQRRQSPPTAEVAPATSCNSRGSQKPTCPLAASLSRRTKVAADAGRATYIWRYFEWLASCLLW